MHLHPSDPNCFLIELADLDLDLAPPQVAQNLAPLREVVDWAETYLCRHHSELGREGPVCPYVQASMRKGLFFLTVCRGSDLSPEEVEARVMTYRDWFLELVPGAGTSDAGLKTILILFPDVPRSSLNRVIDERQRKLKAEYVRKELMIGEFHDGPPEKPGLWNPDFRPLRSPVPMLVIRHMVPTDFAFLKDERHYLEAYLEIHGDRVPAHLRRQVRERAIELGVRMAAPEDLAVIHPRVLEALDRHGVPFSVHRHAELPQPIRGPADVAAALGYPVERITKSLFVRCRDEERYGIVVCAVSKRLDLRQVAGLLGCRRVELASQAELSAWLGFSAGGVAPIASDGVPVILDRELLSHPTVLTAAGEVRVEIEISPRDLLRVTRARQADLQPEAQGLPA